MDLDGPMGENVVVVVQLLLSTIYVGWKLRVEMCLEKSTKSSNDSFILLLLNLIYIVHFGSIVANWENFGPPFRW